MCLSMRDRLIWSIGLMQQLTIISEIKSIHFIICSTPYTLPVTEFSSTFLVLLWIMQNLIGLVGSLWTLLSAICRPFWCLPVLSLPQIPPIMNIEKMDALPSPRVIKSHLPLNYLPPKLLDTCKVVYVTRNPKDVIVSYYHYSKMVKLYGYTGTLDQFAQYFMDGEGIDLKFFSHQRGIYSVIIFTF